MEGFRFCGDVEEFLGGGLQRATHAGPCDRRLCMIMAILCPFRSRGGSVWRTSNKASGPPPSQRKNKHRGDRYQVILRASCGTSSTPRLEREEKEKSKQGVGGEAVQIIGASWSHGEECRNPLRRAEGHRRQGGERKRGPGNRQHNCETFQVS